MCYDPGNYVAGNNTFYLDVGLTKENLLTGNSAKGRQTYMPSKLWMRAGKENRTNILTCCNMCTTTNQTVTIHGSKVAVGISRYPGQRINKGQAENRKGRK